jgi:hypothetical protein
MKAPHEVWVTVDSECDEPYEISRSKDRAEELLKINQSQCDAYSGDEVARYLLATLTCGDCRSEGTHGCTHYQAFTGGRYMHPSGENPACMAFTPREVIVVGEWR